MRKLQFLLLDTGPIIKLFELGIWEEFISRCDVTVSRTVAEESKYASREFEDICIELESYTAQSRIKIIDVELSNIRIFRDKFDLTNRAIIHTGELETLAFMHTSSENWKVCAADHVVFRVLGLLGKSEQGISLEEILKQIGLYNRNLEWQYTKKFREHYTRLGQKDFIQDRGLQ
jgi:hypothetical protein